LTGFCIHIFGKLQEFCMKKISRRDFLKYCGTAAGVIGLSLSNLDLLAKTLADPGSPTVIWLHGSGCQGDSISMLNRIVSSGPATTIDDVLINHINLAYHAVIMTPAGESAAVAAMKAKREGNYILAVEGGIPTFFNGEACTVWSYKGREVTYLEAVLDMARSTGTILAVGSCAAYGGISKAPPNPSGVKGLSELLEDENITGKTVINIPGCPAHPDWIIGTIVRLLLGETIDLDTHKRPTIFYGKNVHDECPRNEASPDHEGFATAFGQDLKCLEDLGCRGPDCFSDCPSRKWNNGVNWCVDSNGMCLGCTEPEFPGGSFYEMGTLRIPSKSKRLKMWKDGTLTKS
jgi:NiFe hydrogenase small subunit HydA